MNFCSVAIVGGGGGTVRPPVASLELDVLDLLGNDDGVALADLLGAELLVVEVAVVLITVAVY